MQITPEELEAMLEACVPGGNCCDPQKVADAIREYVAKMQVKQE